MIIEETIGTVHDPAFTGLEWDYVDIAWFDVSKRLGRLMTRSGLELGLRLNQEAEVRGLCQGDVLIATEGRAVVVNIVSVECLVVTEAERDRLVLLCYEVGNRHAALFYDAVAREFLLPYDEPMEELLRGLGLAFERREARLYPEQRVGSSQGHAHGHGHGHVHGQGHGHGYGHENNHGHEHG